ncbi:hypothetical protein KIPB_008848, partial [Kipferlia bialata]
SALRPILSLSLRVAVVGVLGFLASVVVGALWFLVYPIAGYVSSCATVFIMYTVCILVAFYAMLDVLAKCDMQTLLVALSLTGALGSFCYDVITISLAPVMRGVAIVCAIGVIIPQLCLLVGVKMPSVARTALTVIGLVWTSHGALYNAALCIAVYRDYGCRDMTSVVFLALAVLLTCPVSLALVYMAMQVISANGVKSTSVDVPREEDLGDELPATSPVKDETSPLLGCIPSLAKITLNLTSSGMLLGYLLTLVAVSLVCIVRQPSYTEDKPGYVYATHYQDAVFGDDTPYIGVVAVSGTIAADNAVDQMNEAGYTLSWTDEETVMGGINPDSAGTKGYRQAVTEVPLSSDGDRHTLTVDGIEGNVVSVTLALSDTCTGKGLVSFRAGQGHTVTDCSLTELYAPDTPFAEALAESEGGVSLPTVTDDDGINHLSILLLGAMSQDMSFTVTFSDIEVLSRSIV